MKGRIIFSLILGFAASTAQADSLIDHYCQEITRLSGGSYQLLLTCKETEQEAKKDLDKAKIPDSILEDCTQKTSKDGGYQTLLSCAKQIQREMSML